MQCIQKGKWLYIPLAGEIDHHRAEAIRTAIDAAFEGNDGRHMLFDFAQVTFMDSSGIGVIIGRYKNAAKRGGKVAIAAMNADIARIFHISGLAKIIDSYPTVAQAEHALVS